MSASGMDKCGEPNRSGFDSRQIKQELNLLPEKEYLILNNIMLKNNDVTSQIDHLILSEYGIFVIETKNYQGLILGDENNSRWIQYLGRSKRYFHNPFHQNYGHIKALVSLLGLNEDSLVSIVCFSNQANLQVKTNKNLLVQLDGLVPLITERKTPVIKDDLRTLRDKIAENNIIDKKERRQHVKTIKNRLRENEESVDKMICPKCGGKLVKRSGKRGDFIGCSNYPKCRFTR